MKGLANLKPSWLIFPLVFLILVLIVINLFWDKTGQFFSAFAPKPGSCLILEEKYCNQGKIIDDPTGTGLKLVVFNLPKGAVLFAPVGGNFLINPTFIFKKEDQTISYSGASLVVSPRGNISNFETSYGFIFYKEKEFPENVEDNVWIQKGKAMATISEKNLDLFGPYNLAVTIEKRVEKDGKITFESDEALMESLFKH